MHVQDSCDNFAPALLQGCLSPRLQSFGVKSMKNELFPTLNLPPAGLRFRHEGGHTDVFDVLRSRYVRLTPEEWVRQHFINFLITTKGYPAGLLGNEVSLRLNDTARRCDSVLFGRDMRPVMIIEYKAPSVALTQKVFDQVSRYNIVMRTPWLVVSNGLQHVCCHLQLDKQTYEFVREIPHYSDITS